MSNSILVTGGAGYIGSHTCKALSQEGYDPIVYDNLSEGFRHNVKWGDLIVGDISDKEKLISVLNENKIKYVLHFAGKTYVGESMKNPKKYFFCLGFSSFSVFFYVGGINFTKLSYLSRALISSKPVKENTDK